jgi:hypothetical protein
MSTDLKEPSSVCCLYLIVDGRKDVSIVIVTVLQATIFLEIAGFPSTRLMDAARLRDVPSPVTDVNAIVESRSPAKTACGLNQGTANQHSFADNGTDVSPIVREQALPEAIEPHEVVDAPPST